jgi:type I restriction enzyme M protein
LRDRIQQNVGDGLNKALGGLADNNSALDGVVDQINFTAKVGKKEIPDVNLRKLITHFGQYRMASIAVGRQGYGRTTGSATP